MKNKFLILAGLALLASPITFTERAFGYSSQAGADPDRSGVGNGKSTPLGNEVETKSVKKSGTAGSSEALIAGIFVAYDQTAKDGYTVTRAITQNRLGLNSIACLNVDVVATGDSSYHSCITKGFAQVRYDGSLAGKPIEAGRAACLTGNGTVRGCYLADAVEATANTGIIPLESKTDSGTDLRVLINLQ